jgi:hypothetical protein
MPSLVSNHTSVRRSVPAPVTKEDSKQSQPFPISMGADTEAMPNKRPCPGWAGKRLSRETTTIMLEVKDEDPVKLSKDNLLSQRDGLEEATESSANAVAYARAFSKTLVRLIFYFLGSCLLTVTRRRCI